MYLLCRNVLYWAKNYLFINSRLRNAATIISACRHQILGTCHMLNTSKTSPVRFHHEITIYGGTKERSAHRGSSPAVELAALRPAPTPECPAHSWAAAAHRTGTFCLMNNMCAAQIGTHFFRIKFDLDATAPFVYPGPRLRYGRRGRIRQRQWKCTITCAD